MDTLKKIGHTLFDRWWILLTLYGLTGWFLFFSLLIPNSLFNSLPNPVLYTLVALVVVSLIWQLAHDRMGPAAVHFGMIIMSMIYIIRVQNITRMLQRTYTPPDYTNNQTYTPPYDEAYTYEETEYPEVQPDLPADVVMYEPVRSYPAAAGTVTSVPELLIYRDGYNGLYKYEYYALRPEAGVFYLKAYEITQNNELAKSAEEMKSQTEVTVQDVKTLRARITSGRAFTIHETNNGHPFGVRFEVWLQPAAGGADYKVYEKNYKVRGWND